MGVSTEEREISFVNVLYIRFDWWRRRRDCCDWSVAATRRLGRPKNSLPSHQGGRRRDWSVTATQETKKLLALSPRWSQCDVRDVSTMSPRRRGDVSRQGDDQFARKSRGHRRDISGSRRNVSSVSLVSSRSRRRHRDIAETSWETSPQSRTKLSLCDVALTDGGRLPSRWQN